MERVVLGARGSALALAQVELVKAALRQAHPSLRVELEIITTSGDRRTDAREVPERAGLKGLFTKEIQEALLARRIDAAIHSVKDLPGETPEELGLAALLPRADTSDVLISRRPARLVSGLRIGTGSVRRQRQIQWKHPGVEVLGLRGNVPTRLRKLAEDSNLDAIVLARAGLDRLGYAITGGELHCEAGDFYVAEIDMLPAIGQGAIGIETRRDGEPINAIFALADHAPTHLCIRAERELLRLLDGDCRLPVGMLTRLFGGELSAEAVVFREGDAKPAQAELTGSANEPETLGRRLFEKLSL